jgi:uncharacterized protein (DUF305 family)
MRFGVVLAFSLLAGCARGDVVREASAPASAAAAAPAATARGAMDRERPFMAENEAAMTKMMAGMTVKPSGDVDRDFVAMMAPHHQGAIDMAVAELRYGHNEQLRRLAQEIIVTQQEEIAAMHLAIGDPLPPSVPSPTVAPSAQVSVP